jgi:N-acetyl-anhydromuramyl-L-alanine amidase AmpD
VNIITQHSAYGSPHQKPNTIIVHAMGEYVMSDDGETYNHAPVFLDRMQLSAHALVAPDGTVYRCRTDDEGAYHARGFNTDSLGIEVLVEGKHDYGSFLEKIKTDYVTAEQYAAVVEQCREWARLHGIARFVRHSDVSPGRKLDPGAGFPWTRFIADLGMGN